MATYTVQINDTPASIAQKLGFAGNAGALVAANQQKKTQTIQGVRTFLNLYAGEVINVPASWVNARTKKLGVSAVGIGGFGLGDPNSDGTLAALIALASSNPTLFATPNLTVLAFQQSWNAANTGMTPLSTDGEYGNNTASAAQNMSIALRRR